VTRRTKIKPKSPEKIAEEKAAKRRTDFAAVGMQPDAADLTANSEDVVSITRASQHTAETARRMDAIEALKEGLPQGAYTLARNLERDMAMARGEHDQGRPMQRVDEDKATGRTDAMLAAADRVRGILARIGDRDRWLLTELLSPSAETLLRSTTWRDTVAYITGETHHHAQGAAVRAAVANLLPAHQKAA
jgi:hypothetical protein